MHQLAKVITTFAFAGLAVTSGITAVDHHFQKSDTPDDTTVAIETPAHDHSTHDHSEADAEEGTNAGGHTHSHDEESDGTVSEEQFEAYATELKATLAAEGPEAAMNALQALTLAEPETLAVCHGLAHELGHANLERAGNNLQKALEYQSDICGSGFIHGMIESSFAQMTDVRTEMLTVCDGVDTGKCYHGVGHGLMFYANNDLPFALQLCDTYSSGEARARCYEGAFMENFSSDESMHPSAYRNPDEPLFPCADQESKYKGACYFYAPRYYLAIHKGAYADMLAICLTAESGQQDTCARGVGSALAKLNLGNASLLEQICTAADPSQLNACIDGTVSYTMVNYDDVAHGEALCEAYSAVSTQSICHASVHSRAYLFQD